MKYLYALTLSFLSLSLFSQTEIEMRTDGIVVPRLEATSVASPSTGQVIYDTQTAQLMYYDGASWMSLSGAFERDGTTVRQKEGYDTDDFVFGNESVSTFQSGDRAFFFDKSKGAFRGGQIDTVSHWSSFNLGSNSFAYGKNVLANGNFGATALGYYTEASGERGATALGDRTIASGERGATALGNSTEANGDFGATALGYNTEANGYVGATALGRSTIASGDQGATALGYFTTASGSTGATAIGYRSKTFGDKGAVTLGWGTQGNGRGMTVVGMYNDTIVARGADTSSNNPVFIIGIGNSYNQLSNALVVQKDGDIHLSHSNNGGSGGLRLTNTANTANFWRIYTSSSTGNLRFYSDDNGGSATALINDGTGAYSSISDGRMKHDIQLMGNVMPSILGLQAKSYLYNSQNRMDKKSIGFIAQEVAKLFPELVSYDESEDLYGINYAGFSVLAIKAIQEQQGMIKSQANSITKHANSITEQEARISRLEAKLEILLNSEK